MLFKDPVFYGSFVVCCRFDLIGRHCTWLFRLHRIESLALFLSQAMRIMTMSQR